MLLKKSALVAAALTCTLLLPATSVNATALPTTGLVVQYSSNSGVTADISGNVSQWNDLSGGHNATQGTLANDPVLTTAATLGYHSNYPVIQFNGSSQWLQFAVPNANTMTGLSIFVVGNTGATANDAETVLSTGGVGAAASGGVRYAFGMGSNPSAGVGWAGTNSSVNLGSGSSIATNSWELLSWVKDGTTTAGTTWSVRNEYPTPQSVSSNVADTSFFTGTWNGFIGAESSAYSVYRFSGQVAEILIYDHPVTGAEYQQVVTYLDQQFFTPVPEPSTGALALCGLAALVAIGRHYRNSRVARSSVGQRLAMVGIASRLRQSLNTEVARQMARRVPFAMVLLASSLSTIGAAGAGIINPDFNGNATGWSFISDVPLDAGFDTPNAPGSAGGSGFSDEAIYQKLSDTVAGGLNYTLSAWVYNDRNTLGGNTANGPYPTADNLGLPLHLRLYAATTGQTPATATLLGSLSIGVAPGDDPLPPANTWAEFTLLVPMSMVPSGTLGDSLMVSLETNNRVNDSWIYADQWALTATTPEPSSLLLCAIAAAGCALPGLRRRSVK